MVTDVFGIITICCLTVPESQQHFGYNNPQIGHIYSLLLFDFCDSKLNYKNENDLYYRRFNRPGQSNR
jgi:hypothetical protein